MKIHAIYSILPRRIHIESLQQTYLFMRCKSKIGRIHLLLNTCLGLWGEIKNSTLGLNLWVLLIDPTGAVQELWEIEVSRKAV